MKILMVSKALVVGAYQRKLTEIARVSDVEMVAVVPPSWRDRSYEMKLEPSEHDGYELIASPLALNGNYHLFFFPRLGRIIDEQRPDVVHIDEEPYNAATFLAALAARRRHIPYVFFTWQNLARSYPPPFRWTERFVHRTAHVAIAGTESAATVLRAKGYSGPVAVIPQFGVDPEIYRPAAGPRHDSGRPFAIGFAGRLVPEKGVPLLVEACSKLTFDFRLTILGGGPAEPEIRASVDRFGLQRRVEMPGPLPSTHMPGWLQQLDVLVLPSLSQPSWVEQFGRILVEAMASRVPVVGSTCGELPNVIGDGGLTFLEGDAPGLASTLERLASDSDLRAEFGKRGRERVLAHYTGERVATETAGVYQRLLGASAANPLSSRGSAPAPTV